MGHHGAFEVHLSVVAYLVAVPYRDCSEGLIRMGVRCLAGTALVELRWCLMRSFRGLRVLVVPAFLVAMVHPNRGAGVVLLTFLEASWAYEASLACLYMKFERNDYLVHV